MSSHPHTVLPWVVRRTRLPLLSLRCVVCRSESATTGEGRFRVNANGKLLDVWLLVRCVSCDRTSKLTVHERAPARSFDPAEIHGYHVNDPGLVESTLLDPQFARRNGITLDWTGAWRLDIPPGWAGEALPPVQAEVVFADPVPVRPDRLIAHGLGLSRQEVLRRVKSDTPLSRPTSSGFTFTMMTLEVKGDAPVGGEAVEDGHGERSDNRFRYVTGRIVERDLAIAVPGNQHQVPAGPGRVVVRAADLRVHGGDDQPPHVQVGDQPGRAQFRDDVGLHPVLVPGVLGEGPVDESPRAAWVIGVRAVLQAAHGELVQGRRRPVPGEQAMRKHAIPHQREHHAA